jgi:hypothetical protein
MAEFSVRSFYSEPGARPHSRILEGIEIPDMFLSQRLVPRSIFCCYIEIIKLVVTRLFLYVFCFVVCSFELQVIYYLNASIPISPPVATLALSAPIMKMMSILFT